MSTPAPPPPATLILSILSAKWEAIWPGLTARLENDFGPADFVSDPLAFDHTGYYDQELGTPITRRILAFERLVPQDDLADIKLAANTVENELRDAGGRRIVNLDPGLISPERLVLATGKNFTHRVYLGKGVFADLTLYYQKGDWNALPWTFPDYNGPELRAILTQLRLRHLARRATAGDGPR
ncbi:MAG: DUF4416 family protein [Desulfovibrionaceae bacterium]|nr:DUF4416 family protein [Desulfovibrionaceae bacterium]MBF0513346.1 DUF4416 family protein [Desulfovibrionaceae bacterium]